MPRCRPFEDIPFMFLRQPFPVAAVLEEHVACQLLPLILSFSRSRSRWVMTLASEVALPSDSLALLLCPLPQFCRVLMVRYPRPFQFPSMGLTFLRIRIRRPLWSGWQVTGWLMAFSKVCCLNTALPWTLLIPEVCPLLRQALQAGGRWWVMALPPLSPICSRGRGGPMISLWYHKT